MKRKFLSLFALAPLLLASCGGGSSQAPSSSLEPESSPASSTPDPTSDSSQDSSASSEDGMVRKNIAFTMESHFTERFGEKGIEETCYYSDDWFLEDSAKMNYDLALLSSMVDGASYACETDQEGNRVSSMMAAMGYQDIERNAYFSRNVTLTDSFGAIIGRKTIVDASGKKYTLLAAFPRNAGYRDEWMGDFNLGEEGMHAGFKSARDELLRFMKHYIGEHGIKGDVKVWIAGYSRGGAVANLTGGFLSEDNGYFGDEVNIAPKNVFVYTIGTPNAMSEGTSRAEALSVDGPRGEGYLDTDVPAYVYRGEGTIDPSAAIYDGIHSFTAVGDYVTKLPAKEWGFTRYGHNEELLYGDEKMRGYLSSYSPEVAATFASKDYSTKVPLQGFDLTTFMPKDMGVALSADDTLNQVVASLLGLFGTRKEAVEGDYTAVLGALTAAYGTDLDPMLNALKSNIGGLVKAGLLAYLDYASDYFDGDTSRTLAAVVQSALGKEHPGEAFYSDIDFLSDLLDFAVNDYQKGGFGAIRYQLIASLIPAPYGALYMKLLDYAKANAIKVTTVDGLLELLSKFVSANKEDETVLSVIDAIVNAIPANYASMLPYLVGAMAETTYPDDQYPDVASKLFAALLDLFDICANGTYKEGELVNPASKNRYGVLQTAQFALSGKTNLINLLMEGATDPEGNPVHHDPVPLATVAGEILDLILPKDEEKGEPMSVSAAADKAIADVLIKGRSEKNGVYVDYLIEHAATLRKTLLTVVFNPTPVYDLNRDIANAMNFASTVQFVYPAHFHELYIATLKTKIVAK